MFTRSRRGLLSLFLVVLLIALDSSAREPIKSPPPTTQTKIVRARDLGIPFEGTPGKLNAITDVPGVEVGYMTLVSGEGKLEVGKGPVRTGVTAILPRGHASLNDPVYAGFFSLNGNGEMTGTAWVDESGFLEGPIIITNTHSVGVARDAVIAWRVKHGAADKTGYWWSLPVVAETWDGWLNDVNGFQQEGFARGDPRLQALDHDLELLFLGPAPTPTRLNNFKPFKLSTALMTVHKDSSHI